MPSNELNKREPAAGSHYGRAADVVTVQQRALRSCKGQPFSLRSSVQAPLRARIATHALVNYTLPIHIHLVLRAHVVT